MMLLTFSRGSRHRNTNVASGNSRSRNGMRNAFFGVFSSQRRRAADCGVTLWPAASTIRAQTLPAMRRSISGVT
jgi:hypothetical protein